MEHLNIDGRLFTNMVIHASNKLEENKDYVNYLNVFPVPDGDTGTNMSMTFRYAALEISNYKGNSLGEVSKILAKGALMGARGNSGVILSQIFRGIAKGFENKDTATTSEFGNALLEGSKSAYKAVMRPTEGTILTIIRACGETAVKSESNDVVSLLKEVCAFGEETLNRTPELLPALKKAKVVDAGGMGLMIILKAMLEAIENNIEAKLIDERAEKTHTAEPMSAGTQEDIKFGYCTEFFIKGQGIDSDRFKADIEKHGDSMVVVALDEIVKVHIHTNDPGLILSKALKLGQLSKIKIDNMREQHQHLIMKDSVETEAEVVEEEEVKPYGFIAVAMGEGITQIFEDLGVDYVIEGGQTMNPSTQDILQAINKLKCETVFVLPNNKNIIMAATQASELAQKKVFVIPSKTIPQGITALTAFNPEVDSENNFEAMKEVLGTVKSGSVTFAVRDTEADGKEIKQNDFLGLIEGKIVEVGQELYNVTENVIKSMVDDESGLITIFYGEDCNAEEVEKLTKKLESKYQDLDVQCYQGNQPLYYFIISVE